MLLAAARGIGRSGPLRRRNQQALPLLRQSARLLATGSAKPQSSLLFTAAVVGGISVVGGIVVGGVGAGYAFYKANSSWGKVLSLVPIDEEFHAAKEKGTDSLSRLNLTPENRKAFDRELFDFFGRDDYPLRHACQVGWMVLCLVGGSVTFKGDSEPTPLSFGWIGGTMFLNSVLNSFVWDVERVPKEINLPEANDQIVINLSDRLLPLCVDASNQLREEQNPLLSHTEEEYRTSGEFYGKVLQSFWDVLNTLRQSAAPPLTTSEFVDLVTKFGMLAVAVNTCGSDPSAWQKENTPENTRTVDPLYQFLSSSTEAHFHITNIILDPHNSGYVKKSVIKAWFYLCFIGADVRAYNNAAAVQWSSVEQNPLKLLNVVRVPKDIAMLNEVRLKADQTIDQIMLEEKYTCDDFVHHVIPKIVEEFDDELQLIVGEIRAVEGI